MIEEGRSYHENSLDCVAHFALEEEVIKHAKCRPNPGSKNHKWLVHLEKCMSKACYQFEIISRHFAADVPERQVSRN